MLKHEAIGHRLGSVGRSHFVGPTGLQSGATAEPENGYGEYEERKEPEGLLIFHLRNESDEGP